MSDTDRSAASPAGRGRRQQPRAPEPPPSLLRRVVRGVVPLPLRRRVAQARKAYREAAAERRQLRRLRPDLDRLARLAPGEPAPSDVLGRLLETWANGRWPADATLLVEWVDRLRTVPQGGIVLECGSGLTTLVAAAATRRRGVTIHTLEHHPVWAGRVRRAVRALGARDVHVHAAPLRDYGAYDWFTLPVPFPDRFDLVLCDGPPGTTRGGRSGCIAALETRANPGTVVILDDAIRPAEDAMVEHWRTHEWELVEPAGGARRHATLRRT